MAELITNASPIYDNEASIDENFERFFDWATSLVNPHASILEAGERRGFGVRRHPLGFTAVYLSQQSEWGFAPGGCRGIARANFYPPDVPIIDDVHCHGFDAKIGNADGEITNFVYKPDFSTSLPEGEGYIGYETFVDGRGNNHVVQATDAVLDPGIGIPQELQKGDFYSMQAQKDFHAIESSERGAITIFCKTPALWDYRGRALFMRKPGQPEPPIIY